jgi:hypothetical protein
VGVGVVLEGRGREREREGERGSHWRREWECLQLRVTLSPVLYHGNVDGCRGAGAVDFGHGEVGVGVFVLGPKRGGVGNEDVGVDIVAKDNCRS